MKVIAQNKKAFHDYDILEKLEAGIVLSGDEVKSLRAGTVSMVGSFATLHQGELYIINLHITPYAQAYKRDDDGSATHRRKLLLHRREIERIAGSISQKGMTIVPLRIYFNKRNIAKVELGVCKHKKAAGKKAVLKERDIRRETAREIKNLR